MSPENFQNKNESAKRDIQHKSSDDEIDRLTIEFAKRIGGINSEREDYNTQYQYTSVDMESVVDNIEEYVIPECQQACRSLWSKNIETFMASDHQDQSLYVLITKLSNENQKIFDELSNNDKRYFFSDFRHCYGIRVKGVDEESANILNGLTEVFSIQDVESRRHQTADDYLENFKRKGGAVYVDEYGNIRRDINPDLKDVSFLDALQASNSEGLYVEKEDRVYNSPLFLEWHKRYQKNLNSES